MANLAERVDYRIKEQVAWIRACARRPGKNSGCSSEYPNHAAAHDDATNQS